ncbi:FAD-dependent oxidoreductase, partial [candidate division KSB1 bacterium]
IPKQFSYLKYVFLVGLVFILPYFTHTHWFSKLCPWGGINAAIPWVVWNPDNPYTEMPTVPDDGIGFWFWTKMGIVAFFLVMFVVTKRPFCYTTCPLGAIFSFFNKFSMFKLEVDEHCTQCGKCREKCALDMAAYENANNPNCVECLECVACENVAAKFNFNNVDTNYKTTPGPSCQSACPLGTEVWRYVAHIQRGEHEEAYKAIREPNPLPSVCARVCHHPCESRCGAASYGGQPVAIRALKRFITDQVDPATYRPLKLVKPEADAKKVAVVGSGPSGLTAAYDLSSKGYKVTIFEADPKPGGMLVSGIPPYRLPREVLEKEIQALVNDTIELKLNTRLGTDITIDGLFESGYSAVFLALGAHSSRAMNVPNEDANGVFPALRFLKAINLHNEELARGHVGVIGGGNSAVDAARVAIRQNNVDKVTIFYRRTEKEMPAFREEIEDAKEEGITLETLVSPVSIETENGAVFSVTFIKNSLGLPDLSGRQRPMPVEGSEFSEKIDTLIVAIGEEPEIDIAEKFGFEVDGKRLKVHKETLATSKAGVFAGGDLIGGPFTVVDAMAAGKKAAIMIDNHIQGKPLKQVQDMRLPKIFIEPPERYGESVEDDTRSVPSKEVVKDRIKTYKEIEKSFSEEDARREAGRCRRCDLDYVKATKTSQH